MDFAIVGLAVLLLFTLIGLGTPIFVALGCSGLVGLFLLQGVNGLEQIPFALVDQLTDYALVAAPMYILMGEVLATSGLGRDLFRAAQRWLSWLPGGLGVSAIGASTTFGAISGVSMSSVAVVGRMAVPEMLRHGYQPRFASGAVVASGALAMLIPPSLMFILYASVSGVSVAALFAGGIVPGLLLSGLMMLFVIVAAKVKPELASRSTEGVTWTMRWGALVRVTPAAVLIFLVLGTIYTGLATPTEAAALGAVGSFIVTGVFYRSLSWVNVRKALTRTTMVSSTLLVIVGSAFVFTKLLVIAGVPERAAEFVTGLDVQPYVVMYIVMVLLVLLGCIVDAASLLLVTTPVLLPAMTELGFDPLWLGVLLVVNLEMAVITPPVGLNLYAMKSAVPSLALGDIFRGVVPYLVIDAGVLAVMVVVPGIATWLPGVMV